MVSRLSIGVPQLCWQRCLETISHPILHGVAASPASDSLVTEQARELHRNLDALIDDSWPLKDIPDGMLLAIYLNPACASLAMLDHTITASGESLIEQKNLRWRLKFC